MGTGSHPRAVATLGVLVIASLALTGCSSNLRSADESGYAQTATPTPTPSSTPTLTPKQTTTAPAPPPPPPPWYPKGYTEIDDGKGGLFAYTSSDPFRCLISNPTHCSMSVAVSVVAQKSCAKGVYVGVSWYDRAGLIDMTNNATKTKLAASTPTDVYVRTFAYANRAKVDFITCN